jgi:hypothetical protein
MRALRRKAKENWRRGFGECPWAMSFGEYWSEFAKGVERMVGGKREG